MDENDVRFMGDKEVRYVSPTGGEKGQKLARFGGADPRALEELALVYGYGEGKYERYNYLKGYPWSLSVDALFRHLFAFLDGEDEDPESTLLHVAHVAWHALTLTSYSLRNLGTDDRVPHGRVPTATPSLTDLWADELVRKDTFLPVPPVLRACKHPMDKLYTSVAGTTNCGVCYNVLMDADVRSRCEDCYRPAGDPHCEWCRYHPDHVETDNPWHDA